MRKSFVTLAALAVSAVMTVRADIRSVSPENRCDKAWWATRHEALKAKAAKGGYEVVFLGDSITHFWEKSGKAVWAENFAEGKYKSLNCGFAGDTTENLLWRIDDGELDGLDPKAFVLLIGTNNTGHRDIRAEPPLDTVLGVKESVDRLRTKFPKAKVVLHPLLPRGEGPDNAVQVRNDAVNRALSFLADGTNVLWCSFNGRLTKGGWIGKDLFPDLLHPAEEGYRIWATALKPFLDFAIDGGEKSPVTPRPQWLTGPHATTPQVSARWFKAGKEQRYLVKRNELAANAGRDYDLVMIGDSITHRWERESETSGGLGVFRERFAGRRVLNLGFGGDGTQSILWAIRYGGMLDGYSTRFVTLLIGTNNIRKNTPEEVAEGIRLILEEIRTRQPQARIALMPLLPRGWPKRLGSDAPLANIPKINELIAPYADGDRVVWLDLRAKFLGPDGRFNQNLYSDYTHPNPAGYRIWADALLPLLESNASLKKMIQTKIVE